MWCRSLVEISTKLRPPSVEVWSKFRPNFDTPSVEVWCRGLVDILSNSICISWICRANFDQTSTLGVSKFGRSLVGDSTLGGRSLVGISTKLRPPSVEVWSNWWQSQQSKIYYMFQQIALKENSLLNKSFYPKKYDIYFKKWTICLKGCWNNNILFLV